MEQVVELRHKNEFEKLLADYHVSDHAKEVLGSTKVVLLVGLAAGGRNSIINGLVATGHYHYLVSDTTRPPKLRDGKMEEEGVQYFFRSEEDLLEDLRHGEFLEAEIIHAQQVSGISIRELERANSADKIVVNEVEIGGAEAVYKLKDDTRCIFIIPPSFGEWQKRLANREKISDQEFKNRMRTAKRNLRFALAHDHYTFVINDDLNSAVTHLDKIARSGHDDERHEVRARDVAASFLEELNTLLAS